MRNWKLSKRLQTIAHFIPDNSKVADIGGDHALLLIQLAKEGRLRHGIVGEINRGPYENAKQNIHRMGVQDVIDVRLGDGLSVLSREEFDFLVISGMGGSLMTTILEQGKEKLDQKKGMVLQPNTNAKRVRAWLEDRHWQLVHETIVEEGEHLYEILVAVPGKNPTLYQDSLLRKEVLFEIGPFLWKQKHPLLKRKLKEELLRKETIVQQLKKGTTASAKEKWRAESEKIKELKRVIQCLSEVTT